MSLGLVVSGTALVLARQRVSLAYCYYHRSRDSQAGGGITDIASHVLFLLYEMIFLGYHATSVKSIARLRSPSAIRTDLIASGVAGLWF